MVFVLAGGVSVSGSGGAAGAAGGTAGGAGGAGGGLPIYGASYFCIKFKILI